MFDARGHAIRLTDEQKAVVDHGPGPALVLAGAGSGKTTTLLLRVRRLVRDGVDPRMICMVTFSKRGTSDMQRRAVRLGVPAGVQYRTLHSVAWAMVRAAARSRQPEVPKRWQVTRIIKGELEKIGSRMRYSARRAMPKPRDVIHQIGLAKAHMVWPDEIDYDTGEIIRSGAWWSAVLGKEVPSYIDWATSRPRAPLTHKAARLVERCYAKLEQVSRVPESAGFDQDAGLRWVTYDDMVALVGRGVLCGADWVRSWYGWKPIMLIDEVQDNAPVNWVTCEFLAGPDRHIMAVGDDMQSIFGFRAADPMLMHDFRDRHPDITQYTLKVNFRSGSSILEPMNRVVRHAPNTLNEGLVCGTGREGLVSVVRFTSCHDEAKEVVQDIRDAIGEGTDPDEIAVLYRINACAGPLEMQLIEAGIPYRAAGSSFFRRGEIRAALGYISCAINPDDEEGWRDCANAPTRYLGNRFFATHPTLSSALEGLFAGELGRWSRGVKAADRVIRRVRRHLRLRGSLRTALLYIFEEAGVRKHFRDEGAGEDDETDVDEACNALVACSNALVSGVAMRRRAESHLSDVDEGAEETGPDADGDDEDQDAATAAAALIRFAREMTETGIEDYEGERGPISRVTLSTIHKAKGLEWSRVYVVGNNPGLLPLGDAPIDEERRLFYVAGTRAKDFCQLSYCDVSHLEQVIAPSQFLIESELIENPYFEEEEPEEGSGEAEEPAGEGPTDLVVAPPSPQDWRETAFEF